jgi:hypothetical protein
MPTETLLRIPFSLAAGKMYKRYDFTESQEAFLEAFLVSKSPL